MANNQIETFADITETWLHAERESDKRAFWRTLTRGGWFRACRQAVRQKDYSVLTAWLDESDATKRDIITFNGDESAQMALTHVHCGLAACNDQHSTPALLPSGFCRDLMRALADLPLRSTLRDFSLTALLVDLARNEGITAVLTLELLEDGAGDFYPAPELAFLRDADFQQAEANARAAVHTVAQWSSQYDVRWRLQRRDGKPVTSLGGPSLGAAFALGISTLLAREDNQE